MSFKTYHLYTPCDRLLYLDHTHTHRGSALDPTGGRPSPFSCPLNKILAMPLTKVVS